MPSPDLQGTLARLYTDAAFLRDFLDDPPGTAASLGLNEEDQCSLLEVDRQRLRQFAASLVAKREREVAEIVPDLARALGEGWGARFRAHAAEFRPAGAYPLEADALRFAEIVAADPSVTPEPRAVARGVSRFLGLRFARAPGWCSATGALVRRRGWRAGLWCENGRLVFALALPRRRCPFVRSLHLR